MDQPPGSGRRRELRRLRRPNEGDRSTRPPGRAAVGLPDRAERVQDSPRRLRVPHVVSERIDQSGTPRNGRSRLLRACGSFRDGGGDGLGLSAPSQRQPNAYANESHDDRGDTHQHTNSSSAAGAWPLAHGLVVTALHNSRRSPLGHAELQPHLGQVTCLPRAWLESLIFCPHGHLTLAGKGHLLQDLGIRNHTPRLRSRLPMFSALWAACWFRVCG